MQTCYQLGLNCGFLSLPQYELSADRENSWTVAYPSVLTVSLSFSLSQDIGHALNVSIYSVLELEELICDEL